MRNATARHLKAAAGVGTLAVCGASGLIVAANPKPSQAPLHPPVHGRATPAASAAAVVLPVTTACARGTGAMDVAEQQAAAQLRTAATAGQRQQILAQLTPAERLDLLARAAGQGPGCVVGAGDGEPAGPRPSISPSVVQAPASMPLITSSYVS